MFVVCQKILEIVKGKKKNQKYFYPLLHDRMNMNAYMLVTFRKVRNQTRFM